MKPDFVLVIDPALVYVADITANEKDETTYIITTHLSKDDLIAAQPKLDGKKVFVVDCMTIAQETIGRAIPNTPMLGALMKISGMYDIEFFKENMKKVLGKLPQKVIDGNMLAIERAYNEVN
jgi:pyruvate ferredoxin oxidoreductase gamma subunit